MVSSNSAVGIMGCWWQIFSEKAPRRRLLANGALKTLIPVSCGYAFSHTEDKSEQILTYWGLDEIFERIFAKENKRMLLYFIQVYIGT